MLLFSENRSSTCMRAARNILACFLFAVNLWQMHRPIVRQWGNGVYHLILRMRIILEVYTLLGHSAPESTDHALQGRASQYLNL